MPLAIADFAALTLLALLQGLTEFLPVSSSGHLVLTQAALGLSEPGLTIDIGLHVGTLLAVVAVYRKDLLGIVQDVLGGRPRELVLLVAGSVPTALVGLGLKPLFEEAFHSPKAAACGLFVTAAVLLLGERARRRRAATPVDQARDGGELTLRTALLVGLVQGMAIWPGISRSGSTIAAGLLLGLSPKRAARFSFLLSIPAIGGAALLQGLGGEVSGEAVDGGALIWAMLFAGFVGWGALRMLLAFLGRGAFQWFALYCGLLGAGVLLLG